MAIIYQCPLRADALGQGTRSQCWSYNQGKRAKCPGCGSALQTIEGHAVLIPWRGDGKYQLADAVREFSTYAGAERAADKAYKADNASNLVARFLP